MVFIKYSDTVKRNREREERCGDKFTEDRADGVCWTYTISHTISHTRTHEHTLVT